MLCHDAKDIFAIGMIIGFLVVFHFFVFDIDFAARPRPQRVFFDRITNFFSNILDPPVKGYNPNAQQE